MGVGQLHLLAKRLLPDNAALPPPGDGPGVDLDGVPDGYRAMADREALKVLVRP